MHGLSSPGAWPYRAQGCPVGLQGADLTGAGQCPNVALHRKSALSISRSSCRAAWLVFEWPDGGFLFRAARQTVVRVDRWPDLNEPDRPDDLGGHLARLPGPHPFGAGPVRLALPEEPSHVAVRDDAGWCALAAGPAEQMVRVTGHVTPSGPGSISRAVRSPTQTHSRAGPLRDTL